jgi:hypothetical protein
VTSMPSRSNPATSLSCIGCPAFLPWRFAEGPTRSARAQIGMRMMSW